jgi:fluoride ion exporter CrcB/FEX
MAMEGAQLLDQGQPWLAAGYRLVTLLGGQMAGVWGSGWDGYGQGTFSTFTFETLRLLEDGAWRYAAWNLLLSGPLSFTGALVAFLTVR